MAMSKESLSLNPLIIKRFCDLCRDAQGQWVFHKTMFDNNPDLEKMGMSKCVDSLKRLHVIIGEYVLHQIVKLHDPATQSGNLNLTFDLIVKYGGWDSETAEKLATILGELESLLPVKDKDDGLGAARNKILSHNDLETIINNRSLGEFPPGHDVQYFEKVKEFLDLARAKWTGGPFISEDSYGPYNNMDALNCPFTFEDGEAKDDALVLLKAIRHYDNLSSEATTEDAP